MPLSQDEAWTLLTPTVPLIVQSIRDAWARFLALDPETRHSFEKRTAAGIINDFMVERFSELVAGDPNVRSVRRYGHTRFVLSDRVVLRLKKLGSDLRARNILTRHARAFLYQVQPISEELLGAGTNLFAGYRLNELQTAIEGIYLVCPAGQDHLAWHLELPDVDGGTVVELEPAPAPETARPRRVVPKRSAGEARREDISGA